MNNESNLFWEEVGNMVKEHLEIGFINIIKSNGKHDERALRNWF